MPNESSKNVPETKPDSGFAIIDAILAALMIGVTFLALASTMASNMRATNSARMFDDATLFFEGTVDSLVSQSFDAILAMNGNSFFSPAIANSDSEFRIDLAVTEVDTDLISIRTSLVRQVSSEELLRAITLRTRR